MTVELTVVEPGVGQGRQEPANPALASPPATVGLLWNGKPNGDVALEHVGQALRERFPGLETRFYKGSMGSELTLLEAAAAECDAVVGCTADCGSCTAWMAHDCCVIEKLGAVTVAIVSSGFEENFRLSARAAGISGLRRVIVPGVYNNIEPAFARRQTEDVVADIAALIWGENDVPSAAREQDSPAAGGTTRFTGDGVAEVLADFNARFTAVGWGDGYPLCPPVPAAVARLAEAIGPASSVLGRQLPPGNGVITREALAVAGALAGCRAGEMPLVTAIVEAILTMKDPARRIGLSSTSAHSLVVLVNGPVAAGLGVNGGRCCLGPGPGNEVNLRVMRAVTLCLRRVGGWVPGALDADSIGSARKFGSLLAENEAESPWQPFGPASAGVGGSVSVWFSTWEHDIKFQGHIDAEQLALAIASHVSDLPVGNYSNLVGGRSDSEDGILLLLSPPHAQVLAESGFSKAGLARILFENTRIPVARVREPLRKLFAQGRIRPEWRWMFGLSDAEAHRRLLPLVDHPELITVVVAGSVRGCDLVMSTFGAARATVGGNGSGP